MDKITNNIEVYKKRLILNKVEFENLMKQRRSNDLSIAEEDRLISLYKILYSYNMVDEINPELLRKELQVKINSVISKLKELLGE